MDYGREYPDSFAYGAVSRFPHINRSKFENEKMNWTTATDVRQTAQKFVLHVLATQILHFGFFSAFFALRFITRRVLKLLSKTLGRKIARTLR